MQEGRHDLKLTTDGYIGDGSVIVRDGRIFGGNEHVTIQGTVKMQGETVVSMMTVAIAPGAPDGVRHWGRFHLEATGVSDDESFHLVGAGPRGAIVEFICQRDGSGSESS